MTTPITLRNQCSVPVWPAVVPDTHTTFRPHRLEPHGGTQTFEVPQGWTSGRIWPRTHCTDTGSCLTGDCAGRMDCDGISGSPPASLVEMTLNPSWTDIYDVSLVDGYSLPLEVKPNDPKCQGVARINRPGPCPPELRVYADAQCPGGTATCSQGGKTIQSSACFTRPDDPECQKQVIGCRSICSAMSGGWIGMYRDQATPPYVVPDWWKAQFGTGPSKDAPARGTAGVVYRDADTGQPKRMEDLVCCKAVTDRGPGCAPDSRGYTCRPPFGQSPFAQCDKASTPADRQNCWDNQKNVCPLVPGTSQPDWPRATTGEHYAELYSRTSPQAYGWQFDDLDATFGCTPSPGHAGYTITFCPTTAEKQEEEPQPAGKDVSSSLPWWSWLVWACGLALLLVGVWRWTRAH